jgi:NADH-quinone oxidoreductase subunit L
MPITFWTYMVATLALAGIFPFAGFWSKDEILAGTGSANTGVGHYHFALIMLLIGAAFTAAYMTRTIWYAFYNGEFKGDTHGHGEPHESGLRMTVPLIILGTLGAIAGFANIPSRFLFDVGIPKPITLKFEHFVEPVGAFFPGHSSGFTHAQFNGWLATGAVLLALGAMLFVYGYYWKGLFRPLHGLAERNRVARLGKTILENKYYLDWLYTDVIVGFVKGRLAWASNWANAHVIDGVVNGVGRGAAGGGRWVYDHVDQELVDGAVNGVGIGADESGGVLRRLNSGHIQQYAALFFAAAAVLAGILVVLIG